MTGKIPLIQFDHHSREFAQNREKILTRLREETPVAFTESYGGHWVVTAYGPATIVLENPLIFSSEKRPDGSLGVTIPGIGPRLLPAETDAPAHTKLRRAIAPGYSPRAMKGMERVVRDVVTQAVDELIRKGEFDIVADISEVVPPLIGLRHLGFPEEHRATMVDAIKVALNSGAPSGVAAQAFQSACGLMMMFARSRRENPTDDLMSLVVQCQDPLLSDEEAMWMGITLLVGGFKNPGAHIANMLLHLGQDLELRRRLIDDRSLIPKATNEFLRFYSAGVSVARTVTQPFDLAGISLSPGDRVLVVLPAANHDDAAFEHAASFDIDRPTKNRNVAFGGGPHFCVGFKLAGMMFEILLNAIFDRIPDYTVQADKAVRVEDAGIQAGYIVIPASTGIKQAP